MRNQSHKHTPEHSIRRMGAGTLVGFLALVGVAAAAAGVSSERNVRDLAKLRPTTAQMRAGYSDMRTGYDVSAPVAPQATTTPVALLMLPMESVGLPTNYVDIKDAVSIGGVPVAKFKIVNSSNVMFTLSKVAIRMEGKKMNVAATKLAKPNEATVNACGLVSFELLVGNSTPTSFGVKLATAKTSPDAAWTFTGTRVISPNTDVDVVLKATAGVTNVQLKQLLEGCSFTPYVLKSEVALTDSVSGKSIKTLIDGKDLNASKLVLPAVQIKSKQAEANIVNIVWDNLAAPTGPATKGEDKVIAVIRAASLNASSTPQGDVQLKGLPMNLNATFAVTGDRELKIYADGVGPSNLVYTKILNGKTWRMDEKLGFYTTTVGSPFTAPVTIPAGSAKVFWVTYDVIEPAVNDTLCISPTRTLTSFISSKVLQFPEGSGAPSTRCRTY